MKILHTSDWHAGKVWKGQTRLDELADVLENLASEIERERIDLVVMTGDIFDTPSPPPEAERLVFGFFRRVGRLQVPSVVIAGNHDSPARVEAWAQLAELAHVTACGLPKPRTAGGVVEIQAKSGERALVAMVPFAPVARLVSAQEIGNAPHRAPRTYAAAMQELVGHVCEGFAPGTVNLLLAHTHLEGAAIGGSERRVHVGEGWAARPQMLPATAHYVGLGHIHLHQQVSGAPAPTWYAGSPLQLDFGEEGQGKYYNVVDARPGQPAHVEPRPYVGGRPLRTVTIPPADAMAGAARQALVAMHPAEAGGATASETDIAGAAAVGLRNVAIDVTDNPHLRVIVDCTVPQAGADINRRVREAIPGVVSVDVRLPAITGEPDVAPRTDGSLSPRELYTMFRAARREGLAPRRVLDAFDELYEAAIAEERAE